MNSLSTWILPYLSAYVSPILPLPKAPPLQLLDISTTATHTFFLLSDVQHTITAIPTPDCLAKHAANAPIHSLRGGIIVMKDYLLVLSPPPSSLPGTVDTINSRPGFMIRLLDFDVLGSENCAPFGSPIHHMDNPSIREVYEKLANIDVIGRREEIKRYGRELFPKDKNAIEEAEIIQAANKNDTTEGNTSNSSNSKRYSSSFYSSASFSSSSSLRVPPTLLVSPSVAELNFLSRHQSDSLHSITIPEEQRKLIDAFPIDLLASNTIPISKPSDIDRKEDKSEAASVELDDDKVFNLYTQLSALEEEEEARYSQVFSQASDGQETKSGATTGPLLFAPTPSTPPADQLHTNVQVETEQQPILDQPILEQPLLSIEKEGKRDIIPSTPSSPSLSFDIYSSSSQLQLVSPVSSASSRSSHASPYRIYSASQPPSLENRILSSQELQAIREEEEVKEGEEREKEKSRASKQMSVSFSDDLIDVSSDGSELELTDERRKGNKPFIPHENSVEEEAEDFSGFMTQAPMNEDIEEKEESKESKEEMPLSPISTFSSSLNPSPSQNRIAPTSPSVPSSMPPLSPGSASSNEEQLRSFPHIQMMNKPMDNAKEAEEEKESDSGIILGRRTKKGRIVKFGSTVIHVPPSSSSAECSIEKDDQDFSELGRKRRQQQRDEQLLRQQREREERRENEEREKENQPRRPLLLDPAAARAIADFAEIERHEDNEARTLAEQRAAKRNRTVRFEGIDSPVKRPRGREREKEKERERERDGTDNASASAALAAAISTRLKQKTAEAEAAAEDQTRVRVERGSDSSIPPIARTLQLTSSTPLLTDSTTSHGSLISVIPSAPIFSPPSIFRVPDSHFETCLDYWRLYSGPTEGVRRGSSY